MAALAGKRIGLPDSRANGGVFEAVVGQVGLLKRLGAAPVVVAVEDEAHAADAWRLDDAEVRLAKQAAGPAASRRSCDPARKQSSTCSTFTASGLTPAVRRPTGRPIAAALGHQPARHARPVDYRTQSLEEEPRGSLGRDAWTRNRLPCADFGRGRGHPPRSRRAGIGVIPNPAPKHRRGASGSRRPWRSISAAFTRRRT